MPSTRSKNILMALLPLVAAGVAWVVIGMGGDEEASNEVNVSISIGEGGPTGAGRDEERLDQAVRDQAAEPALASEQRRESAASAEAGEMASPWVSRVPRDAQWIRGRIEFPGETPADEELWVIAEGARFFENDDSPRRHRGKVEQDGRFAVAVGARTPRKAKLWVRGRYLYLAEPEYVELGGEEEVVLEPLAAAHDRGQKVPHLLRRHLLHHLLRAPALQAQESLQPLRAHAGAPKTIPRAKHCSGPVHLRQTRLRRSRRPGL